MTDSVTIARTDVISFRYQSSPLAQSVKSETVNVEFMESAVSACLLILAQSIEWQTVESSGNCDCNNKGAVTANQLDKIWSPSDMLAPGADVILALIALKRRVQTNITCQYIPSHQDTKDKKKCKEQREKRNTESEGETMPN